MHGDSLVDLLSLSRVILMEGSVYELLRRDPELEFDSEIAHAGLIYDRRSREILAGVHRHYLDIAARHGLPAVVLADTWRASGERIERSRFRGRSVNRDNVEFMRAIVDGADSAAFVGALTGPRGDGYRPAEAPATEEALRYHRFQIEELASAGVDLLMAATLPHVGEATAIARLMSSTNLPFLISFVVRPDGRVLDGTPLGDAIRSIDAVTPRPALGFSINCVHPKVATGALETLRPETLARVIAFQANTSDLRPEDLDDLAELESGDPAAFAAELATLAHATRLRMVGGCCGTDGRHMDALAARLESA